MVREYWTIYRGPCLLAVVYDLAPSQPPHPSSESKLSAFLLSPSSLLMGEEGRGWGRSQSMTARKPDLLSIINNSLSIRNACRLGIFNTPESLDFGLPSISSIFFEHQRTVLVVWGLFSVTLSYHAAFLGTGVGPYLILILWWPCKKPVTVKTCVTKSTQNHWQTNLHNPHVTQRRLYKCGKQHKKQTKPSPISLKGQYDEMYIFAMKVSNNRLVLMVFKSFDWLIVVIFKH